MATRASAPFSLVRVKLCKIRASVAGLLLLGELSGTAGNTPELLPGLSIIPDLTESTFYQSFRRLVIEFMPRQFSQ